MKTSTGNLNKHLSYEHKILDSDNISTKSLQTIKTFFDPSPTIRAGLNPLNKKRQLVFDIVLLCCRDLLAFNLVAGQGMFDFSVVSIHERFNSLSYYYNQRQKFAEI